jgi:long-chain acyl-CoA synthetase
MKEELLPDRCVVDLWDHWEGEIICNYSKKTWLAIQLKETSELVIEKLKKFNLKPGDLVLAALGNTVAFPVVLFSLLKIGCNVLLTSSSMPNYELKKILDCFKIKFLIHDIIEKSTRIDIKNSNDLDNCDISIGNIQVNAFWTSKDIVNRNLQFQGRVLFLTSGTSGTPKLCSRSQKCIKNEAINYTNRFSHYNKIKIAVTSPLSHAYAFGIGLISSLLTHSTLELFPHFNPRILINKFLHAPADIITIVPPMIDSLLKFTKGNNQRFFKTIFCSGSHANDSDINNFESYFNTKLYINYGSTETGGISSTYATDRKLKGVGRSFDNVDVKIIKNEEYLDFGKDCGEIIVKSNSFMNGYIDEIVNISGYWSTGDIGYFDDENNIHIVGRIKEIINVGGHKVDPKQVEAIIRLFPDVIDAIVYAEFLDNQNENIHAAITTTNPDIDFYKLTSFCYEHLIDYKVPVKFTIIDEIPQTSSGKFKRFMIPKLTNC